MSSSANGTGSSAGYGNGNGDSRDGGRVVVKICGLTSAAAVAAVAAAGADRCGFVFTESLRQVSPARARALAAELPARIARVAVLKRADQRLVDRIFDVFDADWLQADAASLAGLDLPAGVRLMPVLRDGEVDDRAAPSSLPDPLLYEAPVSGAGRRADWGAAARLARTRWLMLAGGLTGANVTEAIRRVNPAGVDVSSGVERERGVKDPALVHAFVRAVRRAAPGGGAETTTPATPPLAAAAGSESRGEKP